MADQEINSFIWKFKYLCAAGCQAALEFKSDGGCVSITLTSNVGILNPSTNQPPPTYQQNRHQVRGPSYERRQQRRKATGAAKKTGLPANVTATINDDEANPAKSSIDQAEKLATVPSVNQAEQLNQPELQDRPELQALSCALAKKRMKLPH